MEQKINITLEDGSQKEFDILIEFFKEKRKYIVYTDYSKDGAGNINIYSGILENNRVIPVEDAEDILAIDKMVSSISATIKKSIE